MALRTFDEETDAVLYLSAISSKELILRLRSCAWSTLGFLEDIEWTDSKLLGHSFVYMEAGYRKLLPAGVTMTRSCW